MQKNLFYIPFLLLLLVSCGDPPSPKPKGYFRIDLPERSYKRLDSIYPYTFEYPAYGKIVADREQPDEKYWINVEFPQFRGKLHISYKPVNNNLTTLTEDSRSLAMKHIPKASAINEIAVENDAKKVYGLIYQIKGSGAASPYQFYVSDSSRHFLRGALYFDVIPNNDSLMPVIEFIHADIDHLIGTIAWK